VEVLENIYLLRDDFVNIYLIFRGDNIILLDTGISGKPLIEFIEEEGLSYENLELVILTHYHFDHTGGLKNIIEKISAQIASHKDEAPLIKEKIGITPSMLLHDGQIIHDLQVIHTPGHTPGHIALLDKKTKALFVGDLIYEENGQLIEIPYKYSMDPDKNRESIKKLLNYEFKHILPSHGKPIIGQGKEKLAELVKTF